MVIEQAVTIPANRRLHFDFEVPREIPTGATARLELYWSPRAKQANTLDLALNKIWSLCEDSSLTVDSFFEMRREDNELEEKQYKQLFSNGDNN